MKYCYHRLTNATINISNKLLSKMFINSNDYVTFAIKEHVPDKLY